MAKAAFIKKKYFHQQIGIKFGVKVHMLLKLGHLER